MIDPGKVFWLTAIGLGVTVAITVLVWTWYQIRAWYWDGDDPAADAGAFLTALRESAREGDVSEEEYRSIQSRLASRIQGTVPADRRQHQPTSASSDSDGTATDDEDSVEG